MKGEIFLFLYIPPPFIIGFKCSELSCGDGRTDPW